MLDQDRMCATMALAKWEMRGAAAMGGRPLIPLGHVHMETRTPHAPSQSLFGPIHGPDGLEKAGTSLKQGSPSCDALRGVIYAHRAFFWHFFLVNFIFLKVDFFRGLKVEKVDF
jgi:hypothetical protein